MGNLFYIEMAGQKISIQCSYPYSSMLCRDYQIPGQPVDFHAAVSNEEVEQEKARFPDFDIGYLESLCLFRKIAEWLPKAGCMVFHGAAIKFQNAGYLFTAPSGTGKSTHIALWKKCLGDTVDIVNGDKPILSVRQEGVMVYGTPWGGKENWQKNQTAELSAACILKRGNRNRIRKLSPAELLDQIISQAYLPADQEAVTITLELLDRMLGKIPMYLLECDISESAVRCSFEAMTGLDFNRYQVNRLEEQSGERQ